VTGCAAGLTFEVSTPRKGEAETVSLHFTNEGPTERRQWLAQVRQAIDEALSDQVVFEEMFKAE
jgi:hypothetical protein